MKKKLLFIFLTLSSISTTVFSDSSVKNEKNIAEWNTGNIQDTIKSEKSIELIDTSKYNNNFKSNFLLTSFNLNDYRIIDLSHIQSGDMPAASVLKLPEQDFFMSIEKGDDYNIEVISYAPHTGTHVDAPYHVIQNGITVERFDPTVLIGKANVISLPVSGNYDISLNDIKKWEEVNGKIEKGEGVLFDTEQDGFWSLNDGRYIESGYPTLSVEAARYLADIGINYIGVESISPDGPDPVSHRVLLEKGILVVENLKDIDKIGSPKTFVIGTIPAVKGASGAWVRLLAFEPIATAK